MRVNEGRLERKQRDNGRRCGRENQKLYMTEEEEECEREKRRRRKRRRFHGWF